MAAYILHGLAMASNYIGEIPSALLRGAKFYLERTTYSTVARDTSGVCAICASGLGAKLDE